MTSARRLENDSADATAVRGIIEALGRAYRAKDADAIAGAYAPDARIADLAPPLMRRGIDREATRAWLDGWDGPVDVGLRDLEVEVDRDMAVCHGLVNTRARTKGGEDAAWWCRATYVLGRTGDGWRITHAHSSVPFHMDGSFRAAVDLEP